jgi:hypothetical protein
MPIFSKRMTSVVVANAARARTDFIYSTTCGARVCGVISSRDHHCRRPRLAVGYNMLSLCIVAAAEVCVDC